MDRDSRFEPPDEQPVEMDCFQASYTGLILNPSAYLVHGIVTEDSKERVKAWLELGDKVIDSETNSTIPSELFYSTYDIYITVKYDREEAYQEYLKSKHYGYWHPILTKTMKGKE